jgi:hypothetical protein
MSTPTLDPVAPPRPPGAAGTPPAADTPPDGLDQTVSFPELVWAHFCRQEELFRTAGLTAAAEDEYRRRLKVFKQQYGDVVNAYWCRHEASGAALTELPRRHRWRPWRNDSIVRFHTATDWRTHQWPEIAEQLHGCETLAIKVGEVLRGTSEKIALQWILAVASRLLGAIDQAKEDPPPNASTLNAILKAQRAELRQIDRYYHRAGQKAARLVYFSGMMRGAVLLAAGSGLGALILWAADAIHPHQIPLEHLVVASSMGALGAVISVMSRMASAGRFQLDHEVGRKQLRRLGSFRPFIGAVFALVIYFALKSNLIRIGELADNDTAPKTVYFYATIAFLAGFSERWAKVLLDGAMGGADSSGSARQSSGDEEGAPT